jgi:hypothetical protein
MADNDQYTIATPCDEWTSEEPDRNICVSLMGDTRAMRAKRTDYLPREPKEDDEHYNARLGRSYLFNGYEHTVDFLVGIAFQRPMTVDNPEDEVFQMLKGDVDRLDRDYEHFAKDAARPAVAEGKRFIFVNYPDLPDGSTRQDEIKKGVRPYFQQVAAFDLPSWKFRDIDGEPTLVEARIRESAKVPKGEFYEASEPRFRRFRLMTNEDDERIVVWDLWRQDDKKRWVPIEGAYGELGIPEIPIVCMYGKQIGNFESAPPLMSLAWLNLKHWQKDSDQSNIEHYAKVPTLFGAGVNTSEEEAGEPVVLTTWRMICADDADAKLGWVTVPADLLGRESLKDLELQMLQIGLRIAAETMKTVQQTATEATFQKTESDSQLRVIGKNICRAMSEAFRLAGLWLDRKTDLTFSLDSSFDLVGQFDHVRTLIEFAASVGWHPRTLMEVAKIWGFLPSSFDVEKALTEGGDFKVVLMGGGPPAEAAPVDQGDEGDEGVAA